MLILSQYPHLFRKSKFHGGKIYFLSSILANVKISIPIFISDNKFYVCCFFGQVDVLH